jgi:hypothetical protein
LVPKFFFIDPVDELAGGHRGAAGGAAGGDGKVAMARSRELIKGSIVHRRVRPGVAVTTTIRGASGKFAFARFRDAMASRMVGSGVDAECGRSGCAAESSPARPEVGLCSSPLMG